MLQQKRPPDLYGAPSFVTKGPYDRRTGRTLHFHLHVAGLWTSVVAGLRWGVFHPLSTQMSLKTCRQYRSGTFSSFLGSPFQSIGGVIFVAPDVGHSPSHLIFESLWMP